MLYNVAKDEYCFSKKYELHIIDRVGGGDSFGGGLIYSMMHGKDTQAAVEFAVAASALKHSIEGDYNMVTVAEVEKLAGGDGSGRQDRCAIIFLSIGEDIKRGRLWLLRRPLASILRIRLRHTVSEWVIGAGGF